MLIKSKLTGIEHHVTEEEWAAMKLNGIEQTHTVIQLKQRDIDSPIKKQSFPLSEVTEFIIKQDPVPHKEPIDFIKEQKKEKEKANKKLIKTKK